MSVILITGTSTGIGLTTALHFGRKGHQVYASMRNPEAAQEFTQVIADEKLPITLIKLDVNDDASVQQGVAEVLQKAGHIDVLVNNAGIGGSGPVEAVSIENAHKTFETNYFGVIRMVQAVLPNMRERKSGFIIMLSSIAGRAPFASHGHYAASKHALEAISEILAQEVRAFNIRVAIIEPGVILTSIFSKGRKSAKAQPNPIAEHYVTHSRRLFTFFQTRLKNPTMSEVVAEAIEHAVTTDQPSLRYLVGDDARTILAGYQRTTDEERVEAARLINDDEYYDLLYKWNGVDLFRSG